MFWSFAPRHNIDAAQNKLAVLVNDAVVAQNGPATGAAPLAVADWVNSSTTFVATGTSTKITFADNGSSDSLGTFVDSVSAYCLPKNGGEDGEEGGGDGEPEIPDPVATSTPTTTPEVTDNSNNGGGGNGGTLVRKAAPTAQPTVAGISTDGAGGDFVTPDGQVLGDQVSVVPYGAPGAGHGGSSAATGLTVLQLLFMQRRKDLI